MTVGSNIRRAGVVICGVVLLTTSCSDDGGVETVAPEASGASSAAQAADRLVVDLAATTSGRPQEALRLLGLDGDTFVLAPGVDRDPDAKDEVRQVGDFVVIGAGEEVALDGTAPATGSSAFPVSVTRVGRGFAVLSGVCRSPGVGRLEPDAWYQCDDISYRLTGHGPDGDLRSDVDVDGLMGDAWTASLDATDDTLRIAVQPGSGDAAFGAVVAGELRVFAASAADGKFGEPAPAGSVGGVVASQEFDQACWADDHTLAVLTTTTDTKEPSTAPPTSLGVVRLGADGKVTEIEAARPAVGTGWIGCAGDTPVVLSTGPGDITTARIVGGKQASVDLGVGSAPGLRQVVPVMSPDGGRLAIIANDLDRKLSTRLFDVSGDAVTPVDAGAMPPSGEGLTPGRFAFDGERVWTVSSATSERLVVSPR